MKKYFSKILLVNALILFTLLSAFTSQAQFITKWKTTGPFETIAIPTAGGGYNYNVDWGDGNVFTGVTNTASHSYATAGTYTVKITGAFPRIYFNNGSETLRIYEISQWGSNPWTSMKDAFRGCINLNVTATDAPVLSGVTEMIRMFEGCSSLNPSGAAAAAFNTWNTSTILDMFSLFYGASAFNANIGGWNTAAVTRMPTMFYNATSFNQDLNSWNTASVTNMANMFRGANSFNGDITSWNTASVKNMQTMFYNANSFNGDISNWNTGEVTNMSNMFTYATSFNKNIGNWNTGAVTNMGAMFSSASSFNQDIGNWNTANVTDMQFMFKDATTFNQDLSSWNTSAVTIMSSMFASATSFNQEIGNWNIGSVISMANMLDNSGLNINNYDNTLIGWASQTPQHNVPLGAANLKYCAGDAARSKLISTFGWTITGDFPDCSGAFITRWKTSTPNESITIPTFGSGYDYNVDWGDGSAISSGQIDNVTHIYAAAGEQKITITGSFPRILFNNYGDKDKIVEISQWGNNSWTSMDRSFWGCKNMNITATDVPVLSDVTDMRYMFNDCVSLNPTGDAAIALNKWNTGNVTDMSYLFYGASLFNTDIGSWNTNSVKDMSLMFYFATTFNQNIGKWNTVAVENMSGMFLSANSFNQNIGKWNTGAVNTMGAMFFDATSFNQDIDSWNTGSVTDMFGMFYYATSFNQDLGNWNTASVKEMTGMFGYAGAFNGDIGNWNTNAVTNMNGMFYDATSFNQNIGSWNTKSVTNMSVMFALATSFNQNIENWNTGAVTNMSYMFNEATSFNEYIGKWNTAAVTDMSGMFNKATSFDQEISYWNTGAVTTMDSMFYRANSFNQNLGNWNISAVTGMTGMLDNSGMSRFFYDRTLKGWDAQTVQNGVPLGALNVRYCNSVAERNDLIDNNGWIITGDINDCSVLPVELISFTVQKSGTNSVQINWTSGVENSVKSMSVQHSSDANNWKSIYTYAPKGSNNNYEAVDNNPVSGNNYYRLLTTDLDGSQRYSDVRSVSFSSALSPNVYPNPTSGSITIRNIKSGDVIVLTDVTGRQMLKKQATAETQMLDIHSLAQGMYFMSVRRDGKVVMNDKITKL